MKNEDETAALAARLAPLLASGDVLCLSGDLGAGKTVFARALIRTLGGNPALEVPSPTFTLLQTYDTERGLIWHFDLYRIEREDEIYELGWEEALSEGIALVEWPERLDGLAPESRLDITFALPEKGAAQRTITLTPQGNWRERNLGL